MSIAAHWVSYMGAAFKWMDRSPSEICDLLSQLYLLLVLAVPRQNDKARRGVYARTELDEATQLRDSILSQIAAVGGYPAFDAIRKLAIRDDVQKMEMRWLHRLALNVAGIAAKEPAWTVAEFKSYAQASKAPLTDAQSLWATVRQDLDEEIRNLHEGKFSIRKMLHATSEPEMQLFLARELELLSLNRYSVFREEELFEGTTPDLIAQVEARHKVRLELKQGDNRTKESLLSDLRDQLAANYMRDQDSNHGLFVVMWKEVLDLSKRRAFHLKVKRIQTALEQEAKQLSLASNNRKRVEVRCFICPFPMSPRNEKKSGVRRARKTTKV